MTTRVPPAMIERAQGFADRLALCDEQGEHTFADLLAASERCAGVLRGERYDLAGQRIAYLVAPGFDHVVTQWGIWRAGGVAVPLGASYPARELSRLIDDARPVLLVADESLRDRAVEVAAGRAAEANGDGRPAIEVVTPAELDQRAPARAVPFPDIDGSRSALMVYTSGTTGRPKGVVTTYANLEAQVSTLVDAWEWTPDDRILHVLPLHHIHGIVNGLACALWSGACCEFQVPDPTNIWERLASGKVTLFMAVPTIYKRLIAAWESAAPRDQRRWSAGAGGLRLMVSGSAALPVQTLERWERITGHCLLERYGMTEIGMGLGNPLHGERRAGTVGRPFAGVEARIVDESGAPAAPGEQGEIEIRGPQVFSEYWGLPDETAAAFSADGWFRTGDEAIVDEGYWRIVGRRGIDVIKTGGYKVSALEIEERVRTHKDVADVAVVGVVDPEWGERVCAAVVPVAGSELSEDLLRAWCKERLAPYKVPKQVVLMPELPRNAMGKVLKRKLRGVFADSVLPPENAK